MFDFFKKLFTPTPNPGDEIRAKLSSQLDRLADRLELQLVADSSALFEVREMITADDLTWVGDRNELKVRRSSTRDWALARRPRKIDAPIRPLRRRHLLRLKP